MSSVHTLFIHFLYVSYNIIYNLFVNKKPITLPLSDIDGIIDLDHDYLTYDSDHDSDDDVINTSQYYFRLNKDSDYVTLNRNPNVDLNAPLCFIEDGELVCEYGNHKVR